MRRSCEPGHLADLRDLACGEHLHILGLRYLPIMKSSQSRYLSSNSPGRWLPLSNLPLARLKQLGQGIYVVGRSVAVLQSDPSACKRPKVFPVPAPSTPQRSGVARTSHPYDALLDPVFIAGPNAAEKSKHSNWNQICLRCGRTENRSQTRRSVPRRHQTLKIPPLLCLPRLDRTGLDSFKPSSAVQAVQELLSFQTG